MDKVQLLAEVEDLVRTCSPPWAPNNSFDANAWAGRLSAVLKVWNRVEAGGISLSIKKFRSPHALESQEGYNEVLVKLQEARFDLRMETVGPVSMAVATGSVFDYFDEIRKVIGSASNDIYFVDPYLDAEFVSRYLGHVRDGVAVRLLARKKLQSLVPAAQTFAQQHGKQIFVRKNQGFHDCYVIVDGNACYQSGASFKDGAKTSPTTLTQIKDAFAAIQGTYEQLWQTGTPVA